MSRLLVILSTLALLVLAWATDNREAMRICQERYSFSTCHHSFNR